VAAPLYAIGRFCSRHRWLAIPVWAVLATVLDHDPRRLVKEFGIGLAVAIAIDVTFVRFMLVPAAMVPAGERMWWPR
jgi:RND superfamily putative drug exporter